MSMKIRKVRVAASRPRRKRVTGKPEIQPHGFASDPNKLSGRH
jgi:hypothetical protein